MAKIKNIEVLNDYKLKDDIELDIQPVQDKQGHYRLVLNVLRQEEFKRVINTFEFEMVITPNIFPRDINVNFKEMIWQAFEHGSHMEGIFEHIFNKMVEKDRLMFEIEYVGTDIFPHFKGYLMVDNYINEVEIPQNQADFLE